MFHSTCRLYKHPCTEMQKFLKTTVTLAELHYATKYVTPCITVGCLLKYYNAVDFTTAALCT